jgi:thiol-disulfide isomerase/thioredoxin
MTNRYFNMMILPLLMGILFARSQGFILHGRTKGVKDSVWLYLETATTRRCLDSTQVIGGRFTLSGKIKDKAEQVFLHNAGFADYTRIWLENRSIQIDLEKGAFPRALIHGSRTQKEQEALSLAEEKFSTRETAMQFNRDYIRRHPGSMIAVYILDVYASTWGRDGTRSLFGKLSPAIKHTEDGVNVARFLSLNRDLGIGSSFADLSQPDTNGIPIRLSSIKGRYILLDFWASWCGPCREANPGLRLVYTRYKSSGFEIYGVSLDQDGRDWRQAIRSDSLSWTNVSELKGDKNTAALIYGVSAIPDNFLIDSTGKIIARSLRGDALTKKLKELLP